MKSDILISDKSLVRMSEGRPVSVIHSRPSVIFINNEAQAEAEHGQETTRQLGRVEQAKHELAIHRCQHQLHQATLPLPKRVAAGRDEWQVAVAGCASSQRQAKLTLPQCLFRSSTERNGDLSQSKDHQERRTLSLRPQVAQNTPLQEQARPAVPAVECERDKLASAQPIGSLH